MEFGVFKSLIGCIDVCNNGCINESCNNLGLRAAL